MVLLKRIQLLILLVMVLIIGEWIELSKSITILYWSGQTWTGMGENPFRMPNYIGQVIHKPTCPVDCVFIGDQNRWSEVDAILFEPQHISHWGYQYLDFLTPFPQKQVGQKWIQFGYEHDTYFPIVNNSRFLQHMDVNITYRLDSHVRTTFACSWGSGTNGSINDFYNPPTPYQDKYNSASFFASNCHLGGALYRNIYIRELMKYITVDSLGTCMKNKELDAIDHPQSVWSNLGLAMKNKIRVMGRYKFTLAFENNNFTNYVSEKVFTALLSGTLPIYMGADNIDDFIPENSVVNTSKFKNAKHLSEHLDYLMKNETAYLEYFEWKKKPLPPKFIENYNLCIFYSGDCSICKHLHKLKLKDEKMKLNETKGHRIEFGEPESVRHSTRALQLNPDSCLLIEKQNVEPIKGVISITVWIYPETLKPQRIFNIGEDFELSIYRVSNKSFARICSFDDCVTTEMVIQPTIWTHIGVTIHQSKFGLETIKLYVNGEMDVLQKIAPRTFMPINKLLVGCYSNSFEGKIDELIVWRKELTPHEVGVSMYHKYRGNEPDIVLYLSFNGKTVNDYSISNYTVTSYATGTVNIPHKDFNLRCCTYTFWGSPLVVDK